MAPIPFAVLGLELAMGPQVHNHPEVDRIWGICGIHHGSFKDNILSTLGWLKAIGDPRTFTSIRPHVSVLTNTSQSPRYLYNPLLLRFAGACSICLHTYHIDIIKYLFPGVVNQVFVPTPILQHPPIGLKYQDTEYLPKYYSS